ncbi:MAG: 6-carboxytetrahydropterin synthase QueD [Candidatus Omnitrophica bacterium]|nr:6-carboxytetrahydropterin synthase QueD [Candidatus Omnitrophota bacterium]
MAYSISVESYFSAAHRLREYRGKCEKLHGHNWRVQVNISAQKLDKIGMVCDFKEAKAALSYVISKLDHQELGKLSAFSKQNPTSELIAEYIFNNIRKKLKRALKIEGVSVWETPTSCATFKA